MVIEIPIYRSIMEAQSELGLRKKKKQKPCRQRK